MTLYTIPVSVPQVIRAINLLSFVEKHRSSTEHVSTRLNSDGFAWVCGRPKAFAKATLCLMCWVTLGREELSASLIDPNSNGLQPTSDGLQPSSVLATSSDALVTNNLIILIAN